jgi:hypothetical protein
MSNSRSETKACRVCGEVKPLAEFYVHSAMTDGHLSQCKNCHKAAMAARHARLRGTQPYVEANARRNRRRKLRDVYGITLEDYETRLAEQGAKCAICSTDDPGRGSEFFPADHDHETGGFRGLLCHGCNLGLAQFGDDPDRLLSAAAYLLAQQDVLSRVF